MDNNIHQAVKDLILEGGRDVEVLNPDNLLDRIEERLITADQLEYKRLQFEVAKQKESKDLWQFENRLHYLQKQAKIKEDSRFVKTYKKGIINNKLREKLMIRDPPITTKAELKQVVAHAQDGILQYTKTFYIPPASVMAGLGSLQKDGLETQQKTNKQDAELLRR